jgi:peptidoglycan/LPS O-acetylase OafA/YrhL
MSTIYAPTFSRLDSLVLGVSLALLKNYHHELWGKITKKGNLWLILGIMGYCCVVYVFQTGSPKQFFSVALNYSLLALSSTALTLSALSQNSILCKIRIPGAIILATWSYAIYLTHKSLIHLTLILLAKFHLNNLHLITLTSSLFSSLAGGWLLYFCIEKPFLTLRNKIGKGDLVRDIPNNKSTNRISITAKGMIITN